MDLPLVKLIDSIQADEDYFVRALELPSVVAIDDDITENVVSIIQLDQIGAIIQREEKSKIDNYIERVVSNYNEIDFIMHFRLSRSVANDVIRQFSISRSFTTLENDKGRQLITAEKHVLSFLWFVGHQTSSYRDVADRFGITISTLFRLISRVTDFLVALGPKIIRYSTEEEKRASANFNAPKFPGVIGAIDGTHIRIDKPAEDPDSYINEKQYFSIKLQGTVSHDMQFMDVFIGYPGSVHDARVFQNSPLFDHLHELCGDDYILLGDSAYPCLKELIVPYKDNGHLTRQQKKFNKVLSSCRVIIENAFVCLKQRFRQLYHFKLRNIIRLVQVIYSCVVLHNLASLEDLDFLEPPADEDFMFADPLAHEYEEELMPVIRGNGSRKRDELCALVN